MTLIRPRQVKIGKPKRTVSTAKPRPAPQEPHPTSWRGMFTRRSK